MEVAANADKSRQGRGVFCRMRQTLNDLVADDCGTAKQDADCQMSE